MVSQRIGRYLLFPPFAVGGVASVHLARMVGSVSFDRTCAIKRLHPHHAHDPEVVAMLLDEARLAARIRHPNVGTVLDVVAEGDELLVVMEYVHGLSLAELRRCEGAWPPPVPVAVAIVEQLLRGLEAAHRTRDSHGDLLALVHRDVSPHNVLVGTDGLVRLVDFGVAQAERRSQVSHTGQVKGKLAYMAPEQLDAEPVDPRADVYAAGVVLWELLTGQRMFAGEDELAGHRRARQAAVVPPSGLRAGVPAAVDAVVARAAEAERDQRWPSAEAMAEALREVGPLARIDEVAAWVSSSGATLLAQRQALLATIEQGADRAATAARREHPELGDPAGRGAIRADGQRDQLTRERRARSPRKALAQDS
ncbi:MAG: serine/threonine protein kinase [Myxococcales bacterium]|nr:serine/threonine protein kinase [Myxococcales bacterium]